MPDTDAGMAASPSPDSEALRQLGLKVRRRLATTKAVQCLVADKAELWAVPRFFDAVECGRQISMIDARVRPSVAYGVDRSSDLRTSYTADLDPSDPFVRRIQRRIDALTGIPAAHGETIQGQRYLAGQHFKPHVDWFAPATAAWDEAALCGGQRTFTVMAYLNEVEEGGETDFPALDVAIAPRQGTLLIWNNADEAGQSNRWTLHAGNPVVRGAKYIITKWYRAGRWR